jgi:peptidoglycan/LPS O-acetylase OafA/YrhL
MKDDITSKAASNRLDWLDAFRGWAVLGVIAVHSGGSAHVAGLTGEITATGQYGVQLFFLVSALTISLTYESHIRRFGQSARSQFAWFIKRFFRIAPLYYLAACFYPLEQYAIYRLSHRRYGSITQIPDILANILFVHTWIPSAINSVVPGGWSIGVEMFFYTLVPFVWMIVSVKRRVALLGVSAVAFLLTTEIASKLARGTFYVEDNSYLYYWFPTQAPVIVLGLIFYFLYGPKLNEPRNTKVAIAYSFGFLACLSLAFYCGTAGEVAPQLAPAILAIGLILFVMGMHGWTKRMVVNKAAIALGKISFSVYIFHFVVLDLIRGSIKAVHLDHLSSFTVIPVLFATLSITSLIAVVSKRVVEDPSIAFGHKLSLTIAVRRTE